MEIFKLTEHPSGVP